MARLQTKEEPWMPACAGLTTEGLDARCHPPQSEKLDPRLLLRGQAQGQAVRNRGASPVVILDP